MINLFEHYNQKTEQLHQTLKLAGHDNETIVIHEDGFLPDEIHSPYKFFAGYNVENDNANAKFFNDVEIPQYWEIEGNNDQALILDMGVIRGKIFYKKHYENRIVNHVEWLDQHGTVRFIDYYTKHGVKFAQMTLDAQGEPILKKYMNQQGQEVFYENYKTQTIVLDWKGRTYLFESQVAFLIFYLKQIEVDLTEIVINSLATPFSVTYNLDSPGRDLLFWQEHSNGEIPGNMQLILNGRTNRKTRVLIPDKEEFHSIYGQLDEHSQRLVASAGYIYQYKKENKHQKQALIMTNSDQIINLEAIVKANEDIDFYIGAITEMSSKLLDLGQYQNVKLFPAIDKETIETLYALCDIYLDINEGNEIENAVRKAFDYDLLILSYTDVTHNHTVTAQQHRFDKSNDSEKLKLYMQEIYQQDSNFEKALKTQHTHANEITVEAFNQALQ
ncbi:accessory Sec system glycosylation chaperone GtfB [Staphylococcus caeli]|uniref:accessory Sec system glycosylation chaperone GtfB n=1 Tax=Staphylococcus caeli TaxID=2201815 RepID=UPI003F56CC0B